MENARDSRLVKNMELMKTLGVNLSKLERIPLGMFEFVYPDPVN